MGCWECFGFSFSKKPRKASRPSQGMYKDDSQECLLEDDVEDADDDFSNCDMSCTRNEDESEFHTPSKRSEEILTYRIQHGLICREFPVKETDILLRSEDENGNRTVNEYVHERKIGAGSYKKVVLYRSCVDGKHYAIKVLIMKVLSHPNIVNLVEVIDDPTTDHFYMVLEYVEGNLVCDGTGPPFDVGEDTARKYLRDVVAGLMYLHAHNIVHGDIKPDNLLVTSSGVVKIADFRVSQVFEIVNNSLLLPDEMNPLLEDLLEVLLCK